MRIVPEMTPPSPAARTPRPGAILAAAVVLCLIASNAVFAQASSITLTLHERLLNQLAAAALPHSETRRLSGEVDLGLTRQPWSVDARFTVQAISMTVRSRDVSVDARIRVQASGVDYTSTATGVVHPRIDNGKLILVASGLTMPLYAAPFGVRIDLGAVSADQFLPRELRTLTVDLAAPVDMPGGGTLRLRMSDARIEFQPPLIHVRATIGL